MSYEEICIFSIKMDYVNKKGMQNPFTSISFPLVSTGKKKAAAPARNVIVESTNTVITG